MAAAPSTASANPPQPNCNSDVIEGVECSPCCENKACRKTFRGILLGQILSVCLCGTGVASQALSDRGVNTPTAQTFLSYFFLCFVYGIALSFKSGDGNLISVFRQRGWKYLFLAILDVEANFIIVHAYQFTNLTSVQLLDCSTIPVVLVLSWLFLSVRYLVLHIIGVAVCLIGIACIIRSDFVNNKEQSGSNPPLGDALCLLAAILYGAANVGEEYMVKQNSRLEYLGMIGLYGSIISGIQLAILEHANLARVTWTTSTIMYYLLFAASMFLFYSLVTIVMRRTSALMFNLSVLTADFYTLLFGIFMFKYKFHLLYFASFVLVITGTVIYSLRPTQRRDVNEPRKIFPCCFFCCCCSPCCFSAVEETDESDEIRRPSFLDNNHLSI